MADGKWVPGLRADLPVEEAARKVLTLRLGVVANYLPLAVESPDDDPEYVHQLRVGTRRSGAALDLFAACLPAKFYRTVRKLLRKVRRAAGDARDWDVFLMAVGHWKPRTREARPGTDFLTGFAAGRREAAQGHLVDVGSRQRGRIAAVLADLDAAIRPPAPGPRTLGEAAHGRVGELMRELHQSATPIPVNYEHLHQVRIVGKRLRYAMEVFADCFPPEFRDRLYPAVEEMQEILGAANDSHVAGGRLARICDWLKRVEPAGWERFLKGIEALQRYHKRRLPEQRVKFAKWWEEWVALLAGCPVIRPAAG
jgi:CHAD domain-containing protein